MSAKAERATGPLRVESPFPPDALFNLYDWALPVWDEIADDSIKQDRETFIDYQIERAKQGKTWGVWRGDELGGYVLAYQDGVRTWITFCQCIFKKSFWGGHTSEPSLTTIARELFDSGTLKIEMWVFKSNIAMQGLIGRLGGHCEGELSAQMMRKGAPSPMKVFSLYPEDLR